ncbi:MAG: phosphatidylglycerophosphatase A [Pelagibacteraceae bacterium]|jgi:phosphatidylglycerophosphatase A|nr:phosphatidylglycerophosphatase A [Pelagibacteraceae bacterium]HJO13934.1 phosphatidylglycerophosphatase A [Alphaproteobacteria bacterium]MBO6466293.1 phosphatidylglycerophosphatase A [Pelagibacteraceae bacterium]MBO6468113.1 phosphatidylglycerophosphatase A [Pelagibacteraceae bacterium]MBO6469555.1 phosphatidylglycerophosphatase A [Pelagibacteraceae bacterium]
MNKISQIFSTLFFIGYVKWAPGTFGSLFSLIIIIFLHNIVHKNEFIILFVCILLMATICIKIYSKSVNKHDAKEIIIDEFLGIYLIIIFSYDLKIFNNEFVQILLILFFFRIFDILKPFPANWIDKNMKNSYGVILDDIVAGIYTIITLALINVFV